MRKRLSLLMVLGLVGVMAFAAVPAHATAACIGNFCSYTDNTATTIEPILVKADAQVNDPATNSVFRTTSLGGGNITNFTLKADNGIITATITTKDPLPTCSDPNPTTGLGTCTGAAAPYGGAHVMVLFKTPDMEVTSPTGCADAACSGQAQWTPVLQKDRFSWFLYYGASLSETAEDAGLGLYDPTGRVVVPIVSGRASLGVGAAPLEPGAGQTFGVLGQKFTLCKQNTVNSGHDLPDNTSTQVGFNRHTSITNGGRTVTLTAPYLLHYRGPETGTNPCAARTKRIYTPGEKISDVAAFAWADHEIGGPQPVGLILGWTWYYDSVPALESTNPGGYKVGTPAGDPNSPAIAGPTCPWFSRSIDNPAGGPPLFPGGNFNPLYTPGTPCTIPNTTFGPGFVPSGFTLTNPD